MPQPVTLKKLKMNGSNEDLQDLLELTPKIDVLFIIRDWNAKVGSQETPGVAGKFGLGIWNEAGQRLNRVLPRKCTGHSNSTGWLIIILGSVIFCYLGQQIFMWIIENWLQ